MGNSIEKFCGRWRIKPNGNLEATYWVAIIGNFVSGIALREGKL